MKIILCRHGETDWSKIKRLQGRENVELNKKGYEDAENLANNLKELNYCYDVIISSTLSRSVETARVCSSILGLKILFDEKLVERDFGEHTGKLFSEVEKEVLAEIGVGYEKTSHLQKRIQNFLDEVKNTKFDVVIIITHSLVIKEMYSLHNLEYSFNQDYDSISIFEI